jgi:hypothetical protein
VERLEWVPEVGERADELESETVTVNGFTVVVSQDLHGNGYGWTVTRDDLVQSWHGTEPTRPEARAAGIARAITLHL